MAAVALRGGEARVAVAARNIANAQTPGYKKEIAFSEVLAADPRATGPAGPFPNAEVPLEATLIDASQGLLASSENALDLALEGAGYMLLRDGEGFRLSRGGRFMRDAEGFAVDAQGRVLQMAGGGDLRLDDDFPEIAEDGTVLMDGVPVAAIALYPAMGDPAMDPTALLDMAVLEGFSGPDGDDSPARLRQGMLERSNVVISDEIVAMMKTQRLAEGGAQLIRAYDQLVGQAISTFSRSK